MDVPGFQRKWIDASQQKERSAYVTHFNDLCEVLGVPKPLDADSKDEAYGFEKGSKIAGAELKKRTLTNLYNQRPAWLQHAHAALDRAVWDAYGWPADEVPGEVEEDVIVGCRSQLRALNPECSGQGATRNGE